LTVRRSQDHLTIMTHADVPEQVEPVLVLVHGTGDAPTTPIYYQRIIKGGMYTDGDLGPLQTRWEDEEVEGSWQIGDRWYQTDSLFSRRISDRLVTRSGADLTREGGVLRFRWTGVNSELRRNDAAEELAGELRKLAERGRRLHIIAHSHGGNVVRRAVDLLKRNDATLAAITSVTTFGTPFFRYSRPSRLLQASISAAWPILLIAAMMWGLFKGGPYLLMAGAGLYLLYSQFREFWWRDKGVRSYRSARADRAPTWRNHYSTKDEAISLLASFNTDVSFMREAAKGLLAFELNGLLALGMGLFYAMVGHDARHRVWVLGGVAAGVICYVILRSSVPRALDAIITHRLRVLAYGNDVGAGIVGVVTYPWPGRETAAVPLPASVEAAIEAHIARNTSGLWARLREGLAPGLPIASQDLKDLVQKTLTWDELAHTVYPRVDDMIDLLAEDLVATGDWAWREAGAGRPAASGPSV
jgi:hypothetical protein